VLSLVKCPWQPRLSPFGPFVGIINEVGPEATIAQSTRELKTRIRFLAKTRIRFLALEGHNFYFGYRQRCLLRAILGLILNKLW
jgi:hypothetical protein